MRDLFYGHFHPVEINALREIDGLFKKSRREYLCRTTPNQRFRELLSSNCLGVSCNYCFLEGVWSWNGSIVFEIENVSWDDVDGSIGWLWYLRRAYVVDSARCKGVFKRFCLAIMEWADRSGIALCFFASSFGFDLSGVDRANYLMSLEDVSCAWKSELTDIRPDGWLVDFYRNMGFKNAYISHSGFAMDPNVYGVDRSFVYVGKESEWRVVEGVRKREMLGKSMV
jgi:GNAT superfamily N-acetyltransferase